MGYRLLSKELHVAISEEWTQLDCPRQGFLGYIS
jgi:hypothetical protein